MHAKGTVWMGERHYAWIDISATTKMYGDSG